MAKRRRVADGHKFISAVGTSSYIARTLETARGSVKTKKAKHDVFNSFGGGFR
jgi:hypothetical protein